LASAERMSVSLRGRPGKAALRGLMDGEDIGV
jgi:hypothetical protein